jgi:hypothetical protein
MNYSDDDIHGVAGAVIFAKVRRWVLGLICSLVAACCFAAQTASGPILVNGQRNTPIVIDNLKITSTTGDCVTVLNSSNVTIRNSEIGPCRGNGIYITGGSGVTIVDSYVHPESTPTTCCDKASGIVALKSANLLLQGNVVAYGEANVVILGSSAVNVIGNFFLNPRNAKSRGHNVIVSEGSSGVLIDNNYTIASQDVSIYKYAAIQEDSVSVQDSTQTTVQNNYIVGGNSPSGCGIIADWGANNTQFQNNVLVDTGQCGIGIADGVGHTVDSNRIINSTPVENGGNTAIYVWRADPSSPPCSSVSVTNNIASQLKPNGTESAYWNGGGCGPVTLSGNIFDTAARALLLPVAQKLPPPLIPPRPNACVVTSPFSTQTSLPRCDGQPSSPPPTPPPSSSGVPVGDNFNSSSLNTGLWAAVDPVGNGSYSMPGSQLRLSVPGGSNHDPTFGGVNNSVRVVQAVGSVDFGVEVKFDSVPTQQYQFQGLLVEQDTSNYLRFQMGSTGSALVINASKIVSRAETTAVGGVVPVPNGTSSFWIRVQKSGNNWIYSWSTNGSTYSTVGTFTQAMTVSRIGPFVGNYNPNAAVAPGFSALVDYFANMASPLAP